MRVVLHCLDRLPDGGVAELLDNKADAEHFERFTLCGEDGGGLRRCICLLFVLSGLNRGLPLASKIEATAAAFEASAASP